MTAPTRRAWVQAVADVIARTLEGSCVIVIGLGRGIRAFMRTCPVKGCRWYWRAVGYLTWGVALGAPVSVGVVILLIPGWPALLIVAGTWTAVAWIVTREDEVEAESGDEEEQPDEEATDADRSPVDPLLALAAQLIGNARGVHLTALLAALHRAGVDPRFDASELRAALAERGVAWRPSVRAPKGAVPGAAEGVAQGVHREDLEAVIGPLPAPSSEPLPGPVATATTTGLTCDVAKSATAVATSGSRS
jgi:hypothetical protein